MCLRTLWQHSLFIVVFSPATIGAATIAVYSSRAATRSHSLQNGNIASEARIPAAYFRCVFPFTDSPTYGKVAP